MSELRAPFTDEQVKSLNDYQRSGLMHPFTCPREHLNYYFAEDQVRGTVVGTDGYGMWTVADAISSQHVRLIADNDGWWCPGELCDYRQDWAHDFMADGSWTGIDWQVSP